MTPKEYLNQVKYLDRKIKVLTEEIAEYEAMATRVTPVLEKLNVQSSPGNAKEEAIIRYIDAASELNTLLDEYYHKRADVFRSVMALNDSDYITLLHLRYFEFKSWEDISEEMGHSISWVYKEHGDALEAVKAVVGLQ